MPQPSDPRSALLAHLAASGMPFTEYAHERVHTSDDAARVRGISADAGAKSLLLKTREGGFALAVLPGSARLDLAKFASHLGTKKVHFATPDEVLAAMGCEVGSCYPVGAIAGLRTVADPTLFAEAQVEFNPGSHTHSVRMAPGDLVEAAGAEIADIREDSVPAEVAVSSETVFVSPRLQVERAVLRLASGRERVRHFVHAPPVVAIVAVDERGRILLTREHRGAVGRVVWYLPIGVVEEGETPEEAAHRELREEAKVDAAELELLSGGAKHSGYIKTVQHYFLARGLNPSPLEGDEDEGGILVVPMTPARALRLVETGQLQGDNAVAVVMAVARLRGHV